MSISAADVRVQLENMGFNDVPDAVVISFLKRLKESNNNTNPNTPSESTPHSPLSVSAADTDANSPSSTPSSQHSRAQYSSNRLSHHQPTTNPSCKQANTSSRKQLFRSRKEQALPAQEQNDLEDEYNKENESLELRNIQRGLEKVLAERGLTSPYKASPSRSSAPHSYWTVEAERDYLSRPTRLADLEADSWTDSRSVCSSVSSGASVLQHGRVASGSKSESRRLGVTRGYGVGGFKLQDRVERYKQYQQEWEQSAFLKKHDKTRR